MKKKIFLATLVAALTFSLCFFLTAKRKAFASQTLSDLSYSLTENLIDPLDVKFDETTESYYTEHLIYLPSGNESLIFEFSYGESTAYYPNLTIEFYDIDFELIGTYVNNNETTTNDNGSDYTVYVIPRSEIPSNAFSFKLESLSFDSGQYILEEEYHTWIMAYISNTPIFEYIEFEPYLGFIDIKNNEYVIEVSYSNPLSNADILSFLDAEDSYAGNLRNALVLDSEEYLENKEKIGVYQVGVSVSDGNNTEVGSIYIHVVDKIKPVITGPEKIRIPVFTAVTKSLLKENFNATDQYDGDITASLDVTSSFTSNPTNILTENITLRVQDSSGNYDTKSVEVEYYDSIPPVISGPSTIMIGYKAKSTIEEIVQANLQITDDLEPHPLVTYPVNEYTGNERKVGTYHVTVQATDSSLVPVTHSMTISVSDNIKPVIFINSYVIETIDTITLSKEDIDDLLYASNILTNGRIYTSTILNDTYTGHENEKGHYIYQVKYVDQETNEEIIKAFQINVDNDTYTVTRELIDNPTILALEIAVSITVFASILILITIYIVKNKKQKELI